VGSKSIEVVAEAEEKRTTVKLTQKLLPGVVVIDFSIPA
jgi:DNA-binding NarL/FixJ family response regulator